MASKNYYKVITFRFILLIAAFLGSLFLFVFIVDEVLYEKELRFDTTVAHVISTRVIDPQLTPLMKGVSFFASRDFLLAAYAVLVLRYLLLTKNKVVAIGIATIGLSGFLINNFLKNHFQRTRPVKQLVEALTNFSFPSGHATSAFIFYGLLIYLLWKEHIPTMSKYIGTTFLFAFALLIGFSRIYLQVHYLSDVIAGFCLGFAWVSLALLILERLNIDWKLLSLKNRMSRKAI
jgi:undecaprenyl-diphosphatase